MCGRMPSSDDVLMTRSSSWKRSITMIGVRPSRCARSAVSTYARSLYPLQMMSAPGVSSSASAIRSSGLLPASRPMPCSAPKRTISSTTRRCWLTLIG